MGKFQLVQGRITPAKFPQLSWFCWRRPRRGEIPLGNRRKCASRQQWIT